LPAFPRLPEHGPLLCGFVLTRIIGWGTTYYVPAVLAAFLTRDLGLSGEVIFGGITVLLLIGAGLAPLLGRYAERHGTRALMSVGAIICALGLAILAAAQGPLSYLASWVVIGIGHSMTLANMGNITVAQLMGDRTRRVIGVMMLVTGLSASVFWPLAAALTDAYGWRVACLVFAAMHLFPVLPIHLAIPRLTQHKAAESKAAESVIAAPDAASFAALEGKVLPADRQAVFLLIAAAFSFSGLVSWGLSLHFIGLFEASGLTTAAAVTIASLSGPAAIASRLIEVLAGDRVRLEYVSLTALLLGALACLFQVFAGGSVAITVAFVLLYSGATGILSIARATLPLILFGRRSYAVMSSRLTVPQNLMFAAAPLIYAIIIHRLGASAALILSAVAQILAFAALALLVRRLNRR
jgi:MFS family permease